MDDRVGAGFTIAKNKVEIAAESLHLGTYSSVFQAEVIAVHQVANKLNQLQTHNENITIFLRQPIHYTGLGLHKN